MVAAGGAAGCVLRYIVSGAVQEYAGGAFPSGTMAVNIGGCFLIGLLTGLTGRWFPASPEIRILLTTGFCGGFTTFSTFAGENLEMIRTGGILTAAAYSAVSVIAGIAATYAGLLAARY